MIKIRISTLENIKYFFEELLIAIGAIYFTFTPILSVLSFWFESLQDISLSLVEYFFYASVIALGLLIVFFLSSPLLVFFYLPFKLLQGIFSIFVEFLSDEEYEAYQELKRKMLKEYQEKLELKAQKAKSS